MGDVIEFPTRSARGWAEVERTLRSIFTQSSETIEMQDYIVSRMKEIFQRYSINIDMSLELPAGLSSIHQEAIAKALETSFKFHEKKLQELMNNILLERFQLEIELYKLTHSKST